MTRDRTVPLQGTPRYRQLWRVIDGAVAECFRAHPDYVSSTHGSRKVREAIVKRVCGAVHGYDVQASSARSGSSPAGATSAAAVGNAADG